MTFKDAIEQALQVSAEHGYHPTRFIQMWQRNPTMHMLEQMCIAGDIQTGFSRLAELGCWSILSSKLSWTIPPTAASWPLPSGGWIRCGTLPEKRF